MRVPPEITRDIGHLLDTLAQIWIVPTESRSSESFGNYCVDCRAPFGWLRISRDRSQYIADIRSKNELKAAGLFRAFDDKNEFTATLLAWLRTRAA